MGDKQRSAKRGPKPTTIAAPTPEKVSFVDEQPADRYNLVFFADYADVDAVLEATDEAYLRLYHDDFPSALETRSAWATKAPGSRSHCKADLIKQVGTLAEIAREIRDFVADHRDKPKKLGTILLAGHGNPQEFSLPLATPVKKGGKRLPLPHLEIGLRNVDVLSDEPPREWNASAALWTDLHTDLMRLKVETDMLHKWLGAGWTDEQTLLRVWCCNLGKAPQAGAKDPLEVLGKMYFGSAKFMIEAPKNKSGSTWSFFPVTPSSPAGARATLFRQQKRKDGLWHPDGIAEAESSDTRMRHTGADLTDAQAEFVKLALRTPPDPSKRRAHWIPTFYVEDDAKRPVFPQDWARFSGFWRRVTA